MTVDMSAFSTEYSFDRNRSGRAGAAYGPAQLAEVDAPAVDRDEDAPFAASPPPPPQPHWPRIFPGL